MAGGTSSRRGTLRIYLGAAPGVGKTFAMLNEGRRAERPRRRRRRRLRRDPRPGPHRGAARGTSRSSRGADRRTAAPTFEEMDVDAILARRPERALVDELAHTNVPGSRNAKRWQDVEELLDAGIDVISTVNIQHLESLNDVVEQITGVTQRETIPDHVVRGAEQVELVDQTPEALRRRMAHGNIYAADKIDAALAHYFRVGQPRRAARARAAVAGRQGRRRARGVPRAGTASPSRGRHASASSWPSRARPAASTLSGGPRASPSAPTAS